MRGKKRYAAGFFIIVLILSVVLVNLLSWKDENIAKNEMDGNYSPGENTDKDNKIISDSPHPVKTVKSPEIEVPVEIPLEDSVFKNFSETFLFSVPKGYTVWYSENVYYIRESEGKIQIALVVTPEIADSPSSVFNGRNRYFSRMTMRYDGMEHRLINTGTSEREKREIGSFTASCECVEAWFKNDDEETLYKTKAHIYYTILKDAGEENGRGVIITAFSEEDSATVTQTMDDVLESLSVYEPTAEESDVSCEISTYDSPKADKAVIAYPSGWRVTENADGMVIITSTDPVSSPYAGMIIEYMADENHRIVDDYAQFSGNYEYDILLPCFTQPVGDHAFQYRTAVTKTELHAAIGEMECIMFHVTDEIIPLSKSVQYSMRSSNYQVKNVRYTFRSNGVDCMLNFIIPNECGANLIPKLLDYSKFY